MGDGKGAEVCSGVAFDWLDINPLSYSFEISHLGG